MSRLLHQLWPLAAVVAFTVVLALQIPRSALFFKPVERQGMVPFVSYAEYGPDAYARLLQKVRMSWQVRTGGVDPGAESRLDGLEFSDEAPLPSDLPLPEAFAWHPEPMASIDRISSLHPPTVADAVPPRQVAKPPDDGVEARQLRKELLMLPKSLEIIEKEILP